MQQPSPLTPAKLEYLLEAPTHYDREVIESHELLQVLVLEIQKQKKWRVLGNRLIHVSVAIAYIIPITMCLGFIVLVLKSTPRIGFLLPSLIFLVFFIVTAVRQFPLPNFFVPRRLVKILVLAAYQVDKDKNALLIPSLLDLLSAGGEPLADSEPGKALSELRHKVIQLLPYLPPENARMLTEPQRDYIRRQWLQPTSVPRGQVAALLLMASAEDWESVPLARALLASTTNEAIKEAAQELLNARSS